MCCSLRSHAIVALVIALLVHLVPSAATAAERSISFSPHALGPLGNASVSTDLVLSGTLGGSFQLNFVLPPDYKPNSVVRVHVYASSFEQCDAFLKIIIARRHRVGLPVTDSLSGIAPQNGTDVISFAGSNIAAWKIFTVRRAVDGTLAGQRAGDALKLSFLRSHLTAIDTCDGDIFVSHVEVRYTTDP